MKSVIFNTKKTNFEIAEQSHLSHASNLARDYFANSGIDFLNLKMSYFEKLSELIQVEIDKLLADSSYQMVPNLKMRQKIKQNKDGVFLEVSGSYFSMREAISFNKRDLFIGFCGWADGCNRTPFIRGFLNWVDWLLELNKGI